MKRLILDLDNTITIHSDKSYEDMEPNLPVIDKIRAYKEEGFEIVILTARNMRTYEGEVGKINIHTLPTITAWLTKHNVPYDEIHVGKPWCGHEGFYVDDKAIRPYEFVSHSYDDIRKLTK